jgi:3-oxoacyl-[acyl-carrier protein] reductase
MPRLSKLSRSIAGRGALITGAASGMGRATALLFADEGAQVAVTDLNEAGARAVAEEIAAAGGRARAFQLDVADLAQIQRVVDETAKAFGRLDIVINNAGIAIGGPIESANFESLWQRALDVMLTGPMRVIRAALPHLAASDAGRIVNIASTEALGAQSNSAPYTTAKHGLVGLTRSLAVDLGARGITVNCICPGPIRTGLTAGIPDEAKQKFARRRVSLKRYGEPEEVAQLTLAFVLPSASYLNGVTLPVDGGFSIQN